MNELLPPYLSRKVKRQLTRALRREGLKLADITVCVSGQLNNDLGVWIKGQCFDDGDVFDFEARWLFDWGMISDVECAYYLSELEIIE